MKHLSRDSWLALGLFLLLLLITIVAAVYQAQNEEAPPLASFSAGPEGAKALFLWLEGVGYEVSNEVGAVFQIPEETDLVLMLEPQSIDAGDWSVIDAWVAGGGSLIVAGDGFGAAAAAHHYDFSLTYLSPLTAPLTVQTPLLTSPPLNAARVQPQAYYRTRRADFTAHLALESGPVLVSFEEGQGRVILSAVPFPFSNAGLKAAGNPALVLNLVTTAPAAGKIWFDEWHHGLRLDSVEIIGPGNWLRYTPAGRALIFTGLVIFAALVLSGRRFGRPVPLPHETARRGPLEYVTAMANLNRRAGHRAATLRRYHHRLKRDLGRRYRLNPTLPDEAYADRLAQLQPGLDRQALKNLLARLQRDRVSESEMIQLAVETTKWLEEG